VLLVSCVLRVPVADVPLERDEGEYGYISQRWALGELPYQTSFNQKFPGVFLVYGLIRGVLGDSPAAIHWGMQLWSLGTLTLIFLLGRKLFSAPAGVAAAGFAALMLGDQSFLGNAANTEVFAVLFFAASVLAALAAVERGSAAWAFATGLLGAAGMSFKQPGVFNLAFVGLYVAWGSGWRVRHIAAGAAGVATLLGGICGYFAANGAWAAFYDNTIGHNLAYASRLPLSEYPVTFWANFSPILQSFWPALVLAAWGAVGPWVREPRQPNLRFHSAFVLVWLAFCLLAVSVGGYFREHYFIQAIPAAALLAGLGATLLLPTGKRGTGVAYGLCGVVAVYVVLMAPWYYLTDTPADKCRKLYGKRNPFAETRDVGRFIGENSSPDDSVLVMGSEPQILYYARRRSATRYILAYPLMTPFPDTEARQQSVMEEVRRNDPKFVVTVFVPVSFLAAPEAPRTIFRDLREYMAGRYAVVGAVYRLDEEGGPPAGVGYITGERAAEAYRADPVWYDTEKPWAAMLVWRRLDR
jgi:hypothetical protein